jgi:preprotein translocase subunit SecF
MFGRTLITSGVTALSVLTFFIWGTGVIQDFAFALLVGMAAGVYSSIYVAAPLTEWIDKRFFRSTTAQARKPPRKRLERRPDAVV